MERYQFTDAELMLLEQLPNPLAVYQFVGRQVYTLALSDGFREMFGYEDKAEAYRLMNQDPCHNTHPDDVARIEEAIRRFITESGKYEVIFRGKKHRGQDYRVVHCIGKHIYKDGTRLAYVAFTDEGTYTEKEDARATTLSKTFNDDKGDIYLKGACTLICQVFAHSPVFRIGGDEFAAILRKQEYVHRDELITSFDQRCYDIRAVAASPWEKADIARGMAVFEPGKDSSVNDVIRRADELMYENKRKCKAAN